MAGIGSQFLPRLVFCNPVAGCDGPVADKLWFGLGCTHTDIIYSE